MPLSVTFCTCRWYFVQSNRQTTDRCAPSHRRRVPSFVVVVRLVLVVDRRRPDQTRPVRTQPRQTLPRHPIFNSSAPFHSRFIFHFARPAAFRVDQRGVRTAGWSHLVTPLHLLPPASDHCTAPAATAHHRHSLTTLTEERLCYSNDTAACSLISLLVLRLLLALTVVVFLARFNPQKLLVPPVIPRPIDSATDRFRFRPTRLVVLCPRPPPVSHFASLIYPASCMRVSVSCCCCPTHVAR